MKIRNLYPQNNFANIDIRTSAKICFCHFYDHKLLFLIFRRFGLVFLSSNLWPLCSLFCWDIFYGYLLCFFPSKWSGCAILQKKTSQTNIKWECSGVSTIVCPKLFFCKQLSLVVNKYNAQQARMCTWDNQAYWLSSIVHCLTDSPEPQFRNPISLNQVLCKSANQGFHTTFTTTLSYARTVQPE